MAAGAISGLYAITPDIADTTVLAEKVEAALRGGARCVQYRNKTAPKSLKLEQARVLAALCHRHAARLIVNDGVDLAAAAGADGVHVGRDDPSVSEARARLGSRAIVGASCYADLVRALEAEDMGVDYVAFGSFYPSGTKPEATPAPIGLLREARGVLRVPVVAIGGITVENAASLIDAGADALAVSGALFSAPDVTQAARSFCALFGRGVSTGRFERGS
ncbi:MAG TPA: thiamine phosphate synthase [Burkholderiales bacterium]|nr:thiamine phosphate synthase [Burkholderiales bacterium]